MLIKADTLLTGTGSILLPGLLRVEGSRIAEVDSSLSTLGERVVEFSAPGRITLILPGLIDCHCHLELSGLAGKIKFRKNQSLLGWLMKILLYRPKRKETQDRWVKFGVRKSLAGGTTTVADISANNRSWKTLIHEPIRKICFAEAIGFGNKAHHAMDSLRSRLKKMPAESVAKGFWKGISPHAPYSTDEDVYAQVLELADRNHWRVMTHLAEDKAELEFIRTGRGPWRTVLKTLGLWDGRFKPTGLSPIAWAKERRILDHEILLAHVNYVDDNDIRSLAAGRASVVYCPLAHHYFHHSPHRYREMLEAGVNVVLGCDSLACSPSLSILDQMRYVYRAGGVDPQTIVAMATRQAARALRLDDLIGTLEAGRWADLIILSADRKYAGNVAAGIFDPETVIVGVMVGGQIYLEGRLSE